MSETQQGSSSRTALQVQLWTLGQCAHLVPRALLKSAGSCPVEILTLPLHGPVAGNDLFEASETTVDIGFPQWS